jgi:hypothetical protein
VHQQNCNCEIRQRLLDTALGFNLHGAAYWPGAGHFVLLELDSEGSCTGEAWTVCPLCVSTAAEVVQCRLADGRRAMLDLVGEGGPASEPCSICGEEELP